MYPKSDRSERQDIGKLSKEERRKIFKPVVEKKRRDRINACLEELKELLRQQGIRKDGMCYSKVEKADILEMAVDYLHMLRTQQGHALTAHPELLLKYQAGYTECAAAVLHFMRNTGMNSGMQDRVMKHLSTVIYRTAYQQQVPSIATTPMSMLSPASTTVLQSPEITPSQRLPLSLTSSSSLSSTSAARPPSLSPAHSTATTPPPVLSPQVLPTGSVSQIPESTTREENSSVQQSESTSSMRIGPPVLLRKPVPIFPEIVLNPYAEFYKRMFPVWRPW